MIDFGEGLPEKRHIDLTPMIDIVFQLLIFFLLTSIFTKPVLPVKLPEAASAVVSQEPEITIGIDALNHIVLNNRPVRDNQLGMELALLLQNKSDKTVHLVSDRSVDFGRVIEVMDKAKQAGATGISVVTDKRKQQ